jgi:drug/metabolite transporter (DMT)-like permease
MNPGAVQAVAAMAPLISVPFARWLQGHRPPALWYLGALIAIAGLALLSIAG